MLKPTKDGSEPSAACPPLAGVCTPPTAGVRRFVTFSGLQLVFISLLISPIFAITNPLGSGDITNSATIADSTVTVPVLRTPVDESVSNNRYEQFSWTRSTSDTGVSHYTMYLDNLIVASFVTHASQQENSLYTATVDSNNVYLNLKTSLSEGEHTWYVIAYGSQGRSAASETKTFHIDTTTPIIILLAVQKNTMYWATNDPYSIPPYDQRHLTVTNKNPLLSGKVEALSNFKLSLICSDSPGVSPGSPGVARSDCQDQTTIINDPDGEWEHRFYNLETNVTYFAYLSATDAAGNSNIFPTFTITYRPAAEIAWPSGLLRLIRPSADIDRPAADIEPASGLQSPVPEKMAEVPPPPPSPRRSPEGEGGPILRRLVRDNPVIPYLFPIGMVGLLAHLAMTGIGSSIKFSLLPKLLSTLFIPPFLTIKDDITLSLSQIDQKTIAKPLPFTTLSIYSLNQPLKKIITDINGKFNLKLKKQDAYRIVASHPGYTYPDRYLKPNLIPQHQPYVYHNEPIVIDSNNFTSSDGKWYIPLDSKAKESLTPLERLQINITSLRSLPLAVSFTFSILSIIFIPSFLTVTLFAIIANISLNQYLYPNLKH